MVFLNFRVFVLLLAFCQVALAQEEPEIRDAAGSRVLTLSPEQINTLQVLSSNSSDLTEGMHRAFWAPFGSESLEKRRQLARYFCTHSIALVVQYQSALWQAAADSAKAGTVVHTEELRRLTAAIEREYPGKMAAQLAENELILQSAANRTPISKGGRSIAITADLAQDTYAGIAAAHARLGYLLNPVWAADRLHNICQ